MDMIEAKITADRLDEAHETLAALSDAFRSISMFNEEDDRRRLRNMLTFSLANMIITDLRLYLVEGSEIHDALRAVVRGERKLEPDAAAMFQRAIEDMENPMKSN